MQQKEKTVIIFIIFVILGIALSIQFRSILGANKQNASARYEAEELKTLLNEEKERGKILKGLISENEKKNEEYLKSAINDKNDESLKKELEKLDYLKVAAGLTDVKGAGIVIRLNDASERINDYLNSLIIHDSDIIKVVNEIRKAGAQAISINNERVIATSEQVCAGPTIRINKNRYAVPFEIKAIGDPDAMYESLYKSDAIVLMINDKIRVDISKSKEIVIPKYNNKIDSLISGLEVVKK